MLWPSHLSPPRQTSLYLAPQRLSTTTSVDRLVAYAQTTKPCLGGPAALVIRRIAGVDGQHAQLVRATLDDTASHNAAVAIASGPWRLAALAQRIGCCCNSCDSL